MQRDLHSIFTTRILLNLREAAMRDRVGRALTSHGTSEDTTQDVNTSYQFDVRGTAWSALSSVVIGVDAWFPDSISLPADVAQLNHEPIAMM